MPKKAPEAPEAVSEALRDILVMLREFEAQGLLVALTDMYALLKRWHDAGTVVSPPIVVLAAEMFAQSIVKEAGIPKEQQERARDLAGQLLPFVKGN